MTGGSIETADDIEYLEALGLLDRAEKPGNVRPRPFRTGRTARIRVSAGETGERVGWFIGRIGTRLFGASTVDRHASERISPSAPDQRLPKPVSRNDEKSLRSLPRYTYQGTPSPVTPLPHGSASSLQPDHAVIVAHPRTRHPLSPAPITYISSGMANGASPSPSEDRQKPILAGSRNWILATEVMEILTHVSPLRNVLRRILGPRGADLLFLGTSVAGLFLSIHSSGEVDGRGLLLMAAQFALGFLIKPLWVDLLFGITGIALFLLEQRRQRRTLFA